MVDPARFLADLDALRAFGRCGSGVVRPAFSAPDIEARIWTAERMREIGLAPHFDPAGNLFGLPEGDAPCFLIGSHTDSQPQGGWLDGALGVAAALEIARAFAENGGPRVAVVSFQDEEGRFGATTGSAVWSGRISLDAADARTDSEGARFGEARQAMAHLSAGAFVPAARFTGFLELHIEQGPWLIDSGEKIGVVERIVGVRQRRYRFRGQQNHAGTTPMAARRDAFRGLATLSERLDAVLAPLATPATVWTIGEATLEPNAASIVPGMVDFVLQWRDVEEARLDRMAAAVDGAVAGVAQARGLDVDCEEHPSVTPADMDSRIREVLSAVATEQVPGQWREMPSGAMHDAGIVSHVMPAGMLFVPSIGGISHAFEEDSHKADLVTGLTVMAEAVRRLA